MTKFNIPSFEEMVSSTLKDIQIWENRVNNENNPYLKQSYREHLDYLKSILEDKLEEMRDIKIKSLLDE